MQRNGLAVLCGLIVTMVFTPVVAAEVADLIPEDVLLAVVVKDMSQLHGEVFDLVNKVEPDTEVPDLWGTLLDRMGWRWNASRCVHLIADSKCHDPRTAKLVVRVHFAADTTRTRVVYVLRTRRSIPDEMKEIARLGGTGVVEVLE